MPTRPFTHKPHDKIKTKRHCPVGQNQGAWGRGRGGRPWQRKRARVFERDNYLCQRCLDKGVLTAVELSGSNGGICDHIIPKAEGGTDDEENLQTLCKPCDREKTSEEASRGILRRVGRGGSKVQGE